MFRNIDKAIAYIESKRHKNTIESFRRILEELDINTKQKNMIHVAGTNGKGSTVNYLRSILNAHGYHVGTFTSPYMIKHNDRIRIDDQPISDEDLLALINKYETVIEEKNLSMFEIDVLIMLDYFSSHDLDYRIIECGIGGANDKTNVIQPIISAITNIGNDHLDQIGPSLYDVINEKMGIIKEGQYFITSEVEGMVLARLQEQCDAMGATMVVVPEYQVSRYPFHFRYRDMAFTLEKQGVYQVANARLALTIANKLINLDEKTTEKAIEEAVWYGRFEMMNVAGHQVILDGAHNTDGVKALLTTMQYMRTKDTVFIFSGLKDKDVDEMIELIDEAGYPIYLTSFNDERASDLEDYRSFSTVTVVPHFAEAIKVALLKHDQLVITGSLHFTSSVRKYLKQNY